MKNLRMKDVVREKVLQELKLAGLDQNDLMSNCGISWISYIAEYRKTGHCGSVNFSTVEFVPVISKLLAVIKTPPTAT